MNFIKLEKLKNIQWPITNNLIFSFVIFYIITRYYDVHLYTIDDQKDKLRIILILFLSIPFWQIFTQKKSDNIYWKSDGLCFLLWAFFVNQKNDFKFSIYSFFILAIIFLVPLTIKLAYNIITNSDEKTLCNEENFFSKAMWIIQIIGFNFLVTLKTLFSYNVKQILIILTIIILINFIYFKYIQNKSENEWKFFILASLCYLIYIG